MGAPATPARTSTPARSRTARSTRPASINRLPRRAPSAPPAPLDGERTSQLYWNQLGLIAYDINGGLLWTKQTRAVSPSDASSYVAVGDIATAPDGSVYVMGIGWSTVVFGAGEPTETVVDFGNDFYLFSNTTIIIAPVFLAHFAADGALEWIEIVANYYLPSGFPLHVDADADGAVVSASYSELIGTTMTPMVLGVGSLREASPPVAGGADAFAARYRSSGSVAWIRHFGGPGSESIAGIALFDSGGALVAGRSPGPSITLGPGETNEETVAFSGAAGFFVRIGP